MVSEQHHSADYLTSSNSSIPTNTMASEVQTPLENLIPHIQTLVATTIMVWIHQTHT